MNCHWSLKALDLISKCGDIIDNITTHVNIFHRTFTFIFIRIFTSDISLFKLGWDEKFPHIIYLTRGGLKEREKYMISKSDNSIQHFLSHKKSERAQQNQGFYSDLHFHKCRKRDYILIHSNTQVILSHCKCNVWNKYRIFVRFFW